MRCGIMAALWVWALWVSALWVWGLWVSSKALASEPGETLRQAVEAYHEGRSDPARYRQAAMLFARVSESVKLSQEQREALAYCRLRAAAEDWNAARGDPTVGKRVAAEAAAALQLAPHHAGLQRFGRAVILAVGGTPPGPNAASADRQATGWYACESANFIVRFPESARLLAETLGEAAERQRQQLFERWSGPPAGNWSIKCEIVVHATAADFTEATQQPLTATGHALVQIIDGRTTQRRIDLRADDELAIMDSLPHELLHVILADLFPHQAPPRWAAEGMAVLGMSSGTVDRYRTAAARLSARGEFPAAATIVTTGSDQPLSAANTLAVVALVDLLVRTKGERSFTLFLRDAQRYGLAKSLERQYGFQSWEALDIALRKSMSP